MSEENGGGLLHGLCSAQIVRCQFMRNTANRGAGMWNSAGSKATILNCFFSRNSAFREGGGIFSYEGQAGLENCIFVSNIAGTVGAIYNHAHGRISIVNSTFVQNSLTPLWSDDSSKMIIANSVLSGATEPKDSYDIEQMFGPLVTISFSCIQGWKSEFSAAGNISSNPMFRNLRGPDDIVGTEDDDLRLNPGSPCIDAGNNDALGADAFDLDYDSDANEPLPFDFEGKPRILNGTVDIGAYESG
jgi:hypothetical protein